MSRRLRTWLIFGLAGMLMTLTVLGGLFYQYGHRWCPQLVIAWSPWPDQVMRADLLSAQVNLAGFDESHMIEVTRRFPVSDLIAKLGTSVSRTERALMYLTARANGGTGHAPEEEANAAIERLVTEGDAYRILSLLNFQDPNDPRWRRRGVHLASHEDPRVRWMAYLFFLGRTRSSGALPWDPDSRAAILQCVQRDARSGCAGVFGHTSILDMSRYGATTRDERMTAYYYMLLCDDSDLWVPLPEDEQDAWESDMRLAAWRNWITLDGPSAQLELEQHWSSFNNSEKDEYLRDLAKGSHPLMTWLREEVAQGSADDAYLHALARAAFGDFDMEKTIRLDPVVAQCLLNYVRDAHREEALQKFLDKWLRMEEGLLEACHQAIRGSDLEEAIAIYLPPLISEVEK